MTTAVLPRRLSFPASDQSPILWVPAQEGRHSCLPCLAYSVGRQTGMSAPPLILPKNMTDPNSPSHWDALASDLGATPPTEEAEPQPSSPPPSQPVTPPKSAPRAPRDKRPSSGPVRAGDWDSIASELGVTPAPQPVAPVVEAKAAAAAAPTRGNPTSGICPRRKGCRNERRTRPTSLTSHSISRSRSICWSRRKRRLRPPRPRIRSLRSLRIAGNLAIENGVGVAARAAIRIAAIRVDRPPPARPRAAPSRLLSRRRSRIAPPRARPPKRSRSRRSAWRRRRTKSRRPRRRRSRRGGKKRRPGDESAPATAGAPAKEEATAEHAPPRDETDFDDDVGEEDTALDEDERLGGDRPAGSASAGFPPGRRPSGW